MAAEEGDSMLRDRQQCGDEKWRDLSGVGGIVRGAGAADFGAQQEGRREKSKGGGDSAGPEEGLRGA